MIGELHDLRCNNDPCRCARVYRVRQPEPIEQAFGYTSIAGLSGEPDTMRGGPDVRLSPGVGAVRVSRRLRP